MADLNIESLLRKRGDWWLVSDEVEHFLRLVQRYFQLRYSLPGTRRLLKKGIYDRLLREFALAARVDVPESSKNAVYLHAILKLSENDFKRAVRDYTLKTRGLDLRPVPHIGTDGSSIMFSIYIKWLREKRQLECFLMDFGKETEETQNRRFEKEFEEKSINRLIEDCKKTGWNWLEKTELEADEERERGKKKGRG